MTAAAETAWMEKHRMRRGYVGPNPIMYCRQCKGSAFDKTLTKHCVGRMLTDAEESAIAASRLNFVSGEWVPAARAALADAKRRAAP